MKTSNFKASKLIIFSKQVRVYKHVSFIFIISILFCTSPSFSQTDANPAAIKNNNILLEAPQILEVQVYIANLRNNELVNNLRYSSADRLIELIHKPQPSIYFKDKNYKLYGENFTNLYTDVNSLKSMTDAKIFNNIEIVTINVDFSIDANKFIDLNVFSKFSKLKYVYIVASETEDKEHISKIIQNLDFKYGVFYVITKNDNY